VFSANVTLDFICDLDRKEYHATLLASKVKGKGKAIPVQAWKGPEGSRRLRLPDFNTIGT
jgi:hypothetical protein